MSTILTLLANEQTFTLEQYYNAAAADRAAVSLALSGPGAYPGGRIGANNGVSEVSE